MKKLLAGIGIVIAVVLTGILIMLFVIRSRTSSSGPPATAMPVTGTTVNIFDGNLELRNFTMVNPEGFSDRTFVSVPRISVEIDTGTIKGSGIKRFRQVRIEVDNVMAVRRKDGKYNFEWILHQKKAQKKAQKTAERQKNKIRIDRLHLVFGRITFLDYTVRGDKPLYIRFDVNLDRTYKDVTDMEKLGKDVSKEFLDKLTVGDIRNFEIKDLPDIARSAIAAIPDATKDEVFGPGKDRDKVLKELGGRLTNKIKGLGH